MCRILKKIFSRAYENDIQLYGCNQHDKENQIFPENVLQVLYDTVVQHLSFNLNLQKRYDYLIPIFYHGKYCEEDGKILLPLAIRFIMQYVMDFISARFVNELQELINS